MDPMALKVLPDLVGSELIRGASLPVSALQSVAQRALPDSARQPVPERAPSNTRFIQSMLTAGQVTELFALK